MIEKGFFTKLDEQFSLRISTDSNEDFIKILELNVAVHGEEVKEYIERIYKEHPKKKDILWFYIEDNSTGQIISSLTLLPLEWQFEGIILPVCEMGFVGTLKEYRGKGLIGKLNEFYERVMMERGYLLSCLKGIPYYYRRFGYEFVLSLDERFSLSPKQIPSMELSHINIRKATRKDIDYIENKYNSNSNNFLISNSFDTESFYFKFMNDSFNDNKLATYVIEENGRKRKTRRLFLNWHVFRQ
jgi:predicted acetyltransferase